MNEYDALIESCRACASGFNTNCDRCMFCGKDNLEKFCYERLHEAAADAIEELSSAGSIYGKAWTLGYDAGRDENMPRWIPVTERLPEKRQIVIVIGEKGTWDHGMFNGLSSTDNPEYWNWKKNTLKHVKWWMPKDGALPEPPKEGE